MLDEIGAPLATGEDLGAASDVAEDAAGRMGRALDTFELKELLYASAESPDLGFDVADRCLACNNCTTVCPTCFCTTVEDVTDLTGDHTEPNRVWDSCFNADFSYIHGGTVRSSTKSRYRQWMTHKLGVLDRPVRHLGLRGLRSLHHLVPGRRSTSPRRRPPCAPRPLARRRSGERHADHRATTSPSTRSSRDSTDAHRPGGGLRGQHARPTGRVPVPRG